MSDSIIHAAIKKHAGVNHDWLAQQREEVIEPSLEIVDAHHHVWDMPGNRYLFEDVLADFQAGHNVIGSVHIQAHSMYRADGPEEMKPVGETEFVNGVAARSASGAYGRIRMCAGIVGTVDILLGARVEPILQAHIRAGGDRFRGIRPTVAWHKSAQVRALDIQPHILMQTAAREAIARIARHGLNLDVWGFFTQLDETLSVAKAFPGMRVIVNHTGGPLGIGPYVGRQAEMFAEWRRRIALLAELPNVVIKLSGLAMRYPGFAFNELPQPPSSDLMASKWKPYIDACIEVFGTDRCMFASNFPVDRGMCNYHVLWNAYKKLTKSYSQAERRRLFSATASEVYRLGL
ncbi:MAG: amidohydrolase [Hyphomicrobiaceae bacterium]